MSGGTGTGGVSAVEGAERRPLRVFINYRRGDSSGYAGRLYDALTTRSDAWKVFMDIDTIEPGVDFTEVIDRELDTCDIVIVVIGPQWLEMKDGKGRRRLESPDDLVRLEIEAALDRNIRVIPTLVQGAVMPSSGELPEPLMRLARRNALELSDARWRYDIDRLAQLLARVQQEDAAEQRATELAEQERLDQERAEHERAEQEAAERATRERREQAKREAREAEERKRLAREAKERERAEREAQKGAERQRRAQEEEKKRAARAAAAVEAAVPAERDAASPARPEGRPAVVRPARPSRRTIVLGGVALLVVAGAAGGIAVALSSSSKSKPAPASAPVSLKATTLVSDPAHPIAGRRFAVRVGVTRAGKAIPTASVSCPARFGGQRLRGVGSYSRSRGAECRWQIPGQALGAGLSGSVRVGYRGAVVSRPFSDQVQRAPEKLQFVGSPSFGTPQEGEAFEASFAVRLVNDLGQKRSVSPASASAVCRVAIPGFTPTAKAAISSNRVVCSARVPDGAGGRRLTVTVVVRSEGVAATKTLHAQIRSAPAPAATTPVSPSTPPAQAPLPP